MTVTRQDIVDTARKALGTKWRHQGRLVPNGVDCVGLVLWTARQLGLSNYEPPAYQRNAQWNQFVGYFREHMPEVRIADIKIGDVLIFRQNVFPCHCGIVTQVGKDPKFIHSYLMRRKVVEERLTPGWLKLVRNAFEYPGVEK